MTQSRWEPQQSANMAHEFDAFSPDRGLFITVDEEGGLGLWNVVAELRARIWERWFQWRS